MDSSLKLDIMPDSSSGIDKLDVHKGFVFKVYGIITMQLFITFFICLIPVVNEEIGVYFLRYSIPIVVVSAIIFIGSLCQLIFYSEFYRRVPYNYLLLFFITICMSLMLATACATMEAVTVFVSIILTMAIMCSLTIAAFLIKDVISFYLGILIILANCFVAFFISAFFVNLTIGRALLGCIAVIIFGMFLLYDTKMIMGNGSVEISCDEYILAAVVLYLDIIMLFLKVLEVIKIFK